MISIQKKIALYAGGCFTLLFLALLVAIYMEMNHTVVPLNRSLTQQVVNARSQQIDYWFNQRIGEIDMLASLASDHRWTRAELLQETRKFETKMEEEYESIRVVDLQANSWSQEDRPFSILIRPYYQHLIESNAQYVVSNPIVSKANGAEIVVILYRVNPVVNEEVVYIAAAVSIEKMKEIAQDISLYDRSGQLIVANAQAGDVKTSKHQTNQDVSLFEATINSVQGWKLVLEVPNSELSLAVMKTQRTALLVGILIGGVFIVLLTLLASSIIRPIQSLRQVMKNVQKGDQYIRADESRNDEIGDLGRSFNEMLVQLYRSEQEKKESELKLVHEQIKPHFLYNTLDTIQWMAADYGADNVVEMVEALSTYFRLGLGVGSPYIPLEQELYHVESYLHIQCVRYEEILDYQLHYDEELLQRNIIRFMLQPLVENAIYHGIKPLGDQKCTISIFAYKKDQNVVIKVENNGVMIPEQKLTQINQALVEDNYDSSATGFGLYSVNHRIRLAFGAAYGLTVSSSGGITKMMIRIPLEWERDEDVEDRNRR
ncbi:two-component system, sensor histidine kinase YesM [Fontibacillus panacisegetis]|uniref:Two-component system, sensor histidine kinase YesM n=1 Tax=Fontibacillus panacisegetis TaxID=670482 RepID=A0A1G7LTS2_9BACL|nr:histidine kinase [Fontibacillus panacisegetis]SDF52902.1 two-component system, sensor histidine kinase YesM [Fontibacillus panacisegetis]